VIVTRTVDSLQLPTIQERQAVIDQPIVSETFETALAAFPALHAIEVREPVKPASIGETARIVFWNAERLKYLDAAATMLRAEKADALILCELDVGMVRSGNGHTIGHLAEALGCGFVFGVEFVELGLGDLREQVQFQGQHNTAGLHGAGFVSRSRFARPSLVRLEDSGRWFDGAFHERRVGGRIAMMAEVEIGATPVLLVSAHYESHSDPEDRALQTATMLDAVDTLAPGRPVLIGGDFNTSTVTLAQKGDAALTASALAKDPHRLVRPEPYEPMFEVLQRRGYEWADCNVPLAPTQRTRPDGTPRPPFGKIDWFFSRGLRCSAPEVIPAVDANGVAISDHDALAVTVRPA